MSIEMKIDDSRLREKFSRILRKMPKISLDAMLHGMLGIRKDFLKDLATRYPRMAVDRKGQAGRKLWIATVKPRAGADVSARFGGRGKFGTDLLVMERGGTVRAKHAKYMAIPGRAVKDSKGRTMKGFHSPTTARRKVKRGWDSVRVGNKFLLIERTKSGQGGRLLFILTPSVSFQPRLGFFGFMRSSATKKKFHARIESTLRKGLKKAGATK